MQSREVRSALRVQRRPGRPWRRAVLGAVSATALLLSACGGDGGNTTSDGADSGGDVEDNASEVDLETGDTQEGGEVTFLQTGLREAYDPVSAPAFGFTTGAPMNAIFGSMAYVDATSGEVELGFLESLEPNDDFTVWTAKLHPNIKFSDGTPLNAEAVVYNIERAADPETGSLFVTSASRITPEAVDELTYTMTLSEPNSAFPAVYAEHLPYVGSPTAIEELGSDFGTQPVGAGPFKVEKIDGSNATILVRNEEYASFKEGEPRLDKITFQAVPDFSKESQALASNQAQIAAPYGGDAIKMFQDLDNAEVLVNLTGAGSNLHMSHNRPPFDDPRAREAITLALDRPSVANAFQPGTPASKNLFPEDSPFYDPAYDYETQNKERAQELFNELAAEGKPVKFDYLAADQAQIQICAQLILSQLSEYDNVDMTIKSVTTAQYITDQRAGNYQMAPVGLYLISPVPELEDYYYTDGALNTFGYSNPTVDAAFDELKQTDDPAKQKELYGTIQEQVNSDYVTYWVGQGMIAFAFSDELVNVQPVNYGNAILWGSIGYQAS